MPPDSRIPRDTWRASSALTASKSAPRAVITSPSTCRPRHIRSAGNRGTSSRMFIGWAVLASRRIRIRRSPSCGGASGRPRSTALKSSIPTRAGAFICRSPSGSRSSGSLEALLAYPFRPAAAIASLIDESPDVLARWDAIAPRRRVVGLAGVDAHAKLALREVDPGDNRFSIAASELRVVVPHAFGPCST